MDFDFSAEQLAIRDTIRELVQDRVAPRAAEIDQTGEYPKDIEKLFADNGIRHVAPLVSLGEPRLVPKQLHEALRDVLTEELRAFLRPEFLNRVDDVILFRPLSKAHLRGIVDIQLRRLEKLMADRDLKMQLTDSAKEKLVELGYEPAFGARPRKRAILKRLQDPLAEEILRGGYPPGSVVKVALSGDEFAFARG